MSAEATGWVFRHSPYSGAAFSCHLAIADTVNDQHGNRFYMSATNLAVKARCTRTTATEFLTKLCHDGFLARIGGGQKAGTPVEYRFLFPSVDVIYDTRGGVPKSNTPPVEVSPNPTPGVPRADRGVSREPTQTQGLTQEEPLAPEPRERDEIFDALCEVTDTDASQLTTLGRGPLNRAVKELRDQHATADEIRRRARAFFRKYPNASLTAPALAKWWATLGAGRSTSSAGSLEESKATFAELMGDS